MTACKYRFLAILLAVAAMVVTSIADPPATQKSSTTQTSRPIEVNLKEMGLFDLDQQDGVMADIPQRFRDLDGKRVTFLCEMWAPTARDHDELSFFQAVYDKVKWSFSGPPLAQNFWDCDVLPNVKVRYSDQPVRVTGIFHVKIKRTDSGIKSIYHMDVESGQPYDGDFPPPVPETTRPD